MHIAIPLGVRGLQFFISLTILALAAALINEQVIGEVPVTTRYTTFTGGFGMIVCGIGAAALFVHAIPPLVPVVLDGLMAIFFLAGGISWAIGLRGTESCSDGGDMLLNDLLNRGRIGSGDDARYGVIGRDDDENAVFRKLQSTCQRARADEVLEFVAFAMAIGLVGLSYLMMRRGSGRAIV